MEDEISTVNKKELFTTLFQNFLKYNSEIEAIIVSDAEGFVIAGETRSDIDLEIISFLTAVVNPILERIRIEFAFQKFGTANFDTDEHRLLFISVNEETTLSLVVDFMGSIESISPFAYLLAEKVAQILDAKDDNLIQLTIPNFQYELDVCKEEGRIKGQIYQDILKKGGDFSFKFIIIGDHEVGKTSIVRRFVENKFTTDYRATIGLNITSHKFEAYGNKININLWDIGAQHYFKRFRKTYYDGAEAAFIVFDLTIPSTFENVKVWHNELRDFTKSKDLPVVIVGNKKDRVEDRKIQYQNGVELSKELASFSEYYETSELSQFADLTEISGEAKSKIVYIETSAKTGDRIQDAFNLITYHYLIKSTELEEKRYKESIFNEVTKILEERSNFTISFITYDPYWSPGIQLFSGIKELGEIMNEKSKKNEKVYEYKSGTILKSFSYDSYKVEDADGVFCIFDARDKEHIDKAWEKDVLKIINKMKENTVLVIGLRASEEGEWAQLIDEFDINQEINAKSISVMFFKIETFYRLSILKNIETMLKSINELLFRI